MWGEGVGCCAEAEEAGVVWACGEGRRGGDLGKDSLLRCQDAVHLEDEGKICRRNL